MLFRSLSIAGKVWHDVNHDASTSGEAGLTGVTVFLDANGNGILDGSEASTTSGADGAFSFGGLTSGTYEVVEQQPTAYASTWSAAGSVADALGSTTKVSNDRVTVTLRTGSASGLAFLDARNDGSIAGTVYDDTDGDGVADSPTAGVLSGVTVYLDTDGDGVFDADETSTLSLDRKSTRLNSSHT